MFKAIKRFFTVSIPAWFTEAQLTGSVEDKGVVPDWVPYWFYNSD